MTADDSWLNLTDQDLEDMLSKYSDPNSRETGELAGGNTAKSSVSACKSARYTVKFLSPYSPSPVDDIFSSGSRGGTLGARTPPLFLGKRKKKSHRKEKPAG